LEKVCHDEYLRNQTLAYGIVCVITLGMKQNLLFVTYGGGHVHMVYPVVHALRQRDAYRNGDIAIHVLGLTGAQPILERNQVRSLRMLDYLDCDKDADAIRWGTELAKQHHSPTIGIPLEESVAYLGLSYKDLVVRLGERAAGQLFSEKGRNAFCPLTIMERVIEDLQPTFVIATNSPRSEAAMIEVANARNIPTMVMTDLTTGMPGYNIKAQHVTFLCDLAKDMFVADGLVDDRISQFHITGNPAMDNFVLSPKAPDPTWMRQHFPEAIGKPIILHADMPAYWDTKNLCGYYKTDAVVREELDVGYAAAKANTAYYFVRPHPSQDRRLHIDWLKGKSDAWLAADCDLLELLRNIDLLIVRTSTVGLQAVYMHRRVLQLSADFHTDMPLARMGVAWGVNAYGEVEEAIRQALNDERTTYAKLSKAKEVFPQKPAGSTIADLLLKYAQ
jgi:hypothetical protein